MCEKLGFNFILQRKTFSTKKKKMILEEFFSKMSIKGTCLKFYKI